MQYTPEDAMLNYMLRSQYVADPAFRFERKYGYAVIEDTERRACCDAYYPSRRAKYRLVDHCRSIEHIAQLCEVDETLLRKMRRRKIWRIIRKLCKQTYMSEFGLQRGELVTVSASAQRLVQLAQKYIRYFTDDELRIFADWIKRYYPAAAEINWAAARVIREFQQTE